MAIFRAVLLTIIIVALSGTLIHPASAVKTVVSITFDDGVADQQQARSILKNYRMHATFYIISGAVGKPGYLTLEQIRGLQADGNEIGSHTVHHLRLTDYPRDTMLQELCDSRLALRKMGFAADSISYPYGRYNAQTEQVAAECGYRDARAGFGSLETIPPKDWYALHCHASIQSNTRLFNIKEQVQKVMHHGGGWVILVFHHICDHCNYWSMTPSNFSAFLGWLQGQRHSGVTVRTIEEVKNVH